MAEIERLSEGVLAQPSVVAAAGAMVVLGEPGAGKTSVLRQLTASLPRLADTWDQRSDACLWVTGGDLTELSYEEELGRHLDSLPPAGSAAGESGSLWVVLDQADESSLRQRLPAHLKRSLRGRDCSRVRFLMACRTADYPPTLTPVLSSAFGASWCVDLVPLSREEAVALADSAQVPGEALVSAAEEAGAAVLAGVPMTLELLVHIYRNQGQLNGTPQSLFARGVEYLAEDPDQYRDQGAVITTRPQRLMVAGRIAAWMLLSGRRSVWRGRAFDAGDYDLEGGLLADGREWTTGGAFDVTRRVVEETLGTALFTVPDQNRIEFRHSSVAAYLAARYLTDRDTTQQQLKNLFLVGAPDGDTASIPAPLREAAAWLVALNPTATSWLAASDPESLAVHSALVRSDEVRQLTVSRLLERAAQIELSDTRWQLSRWDLDHPGLADQLADVLETAPHEGTGEWQTTARIRLAIGLAEDARGTSARLADALLRLVENDAWHQTERRLAARSAFACGAAERVVPVLQRVLASLAEKTATKEQDPDHELRGTLLTILWPDHLEVDAVIAALRPPSPRLYGSYAQFLREMPHRCTEEQLPEILAWAEQAVLSRGESGNGFEFSPDRLEGRLIDSIMERALRSRDAHRHMSILAKVLLSLFRDHMKVRLPDALQSDDQDGETGHVQSLRRALTRAFVEEAVVVGVDPREAAYLISYDWDRHPPTRWSGVSSGPQPEIRHQLVDAADFEWAMEQVVQAAESADRALVAAYGELASCLYPRNDQKAFELAYDEAHPAWPYLSPFFEPIALDSRLAQTLRRNHNASNRSWSQADEFLTEQSRLLADSRQGDNESLWQFLWRLRVDTQAGRIEDVSGPISTWVGSVALGDDLSDICDLAVRYLGAESDRADAWIENSERNKRSWAGYVLLAELHANGRLGELSPSVWSAWAAAILTEVPGMSMNYAEPSRLDLLRLASRHAPDVLAQRVTQLTLAALRAARQPIELNVLDPRWSVELMSAMELLAVEISISLGGDLSSLEGMSPDVSDREPSLCLPDGEESRGAAMRTWGRILGALLAADSRTARHIIDGILDSTVEGVDSAQVAVLAARTLLVSDAGSHWSHVKEFVSSDPSLGRQLVEGCTRHETDRIQGSLDEAGLSDLYAWLSGLYAPEGDSRSLEAHWVSSEEEARDWRDGLLRELSRRATDDAIRQLKSLALQYPDRLAVVAAHAAAVKQNATAGWNQLRAEDVMRVLQDSARRVVCTTADLMEVVEEVLQGVGRDIPAHGELLWDRTPGKASRKNPEASVPDVWRPKPEAALCAYLAHELNLRLAGRRVAVNREVLVHPTDAYGAGDRTDILIEALPPVGEVSRVSEDSSVKLVIEVKGSWNKGLLTSQDDQLSGRYLPEVQTNAGIFFVGWYPIDLWDAVGDSRKTEAKKLVRDDLLTALRDQAALLCQERSVHLLPMVMTIPRPHKQ